MLVCADNSLLVCAVRLTHQHYTLWDWPTSIILYGTDPPALYSMGLTHQHYTLWDWPTNIILCETDPPTLYSVQLTHQHYTLWDWPTNIKLHETDPPTLYSMTVWDWPTNIILCETDPPASYSVRLTHQHYTLLILHQLAQSLEFILEWHESRGPHAWPKIAELSSQGLPPPPSPTPPTYVCPILIVDGFRKKIVLFDRRWF